LWCIGPSSSQAAAHTPRQGASFNIATRGQELCVTTFSPNVEGLLLGIGDVF
jgi:hypothetical protein